MAEAIQADVEVVESRQAAGALLEPLRARILAAAREPASATEIARRLGLPRQRVHYHVRELERARLLRPAGRRRRRNLIERRFIATARSYVLAPALLGPLAADWRAVADTGSAAYLLALIEQVRDDLAAEAAEANAVAADASGGRPATVSLKAQFRLESEAQKAAFAAALREALVAAIARGTSPDRRADGKAGAGQRHRLVLACYPVSGREERPGGGRT
ncbi:MAG TPA: helix-turn-helix domain-containing protein [Thermoanaerobaculia bacterium]|nr:helix-turn-helix domain-containing protein [Thermoanaerobaculia bacterium]